MVKKKKKHPKTSLVIVPSKEKKKHHRNKSKKRLLIRDWLNLPQDLLVLIAVNLTEDLSDLHRFRQVCRQWRSAVTKRIIPQPLYLDIESCTPCFFCFRTGKKFKFQIPGVTPHYMPYTIFTSSCGWLLIEIFGHLDRKQPRLALFNPLSGVLVPLKYPTSKSHIFLCKIISLPDDESAADHTNLVVMVACNVYPTIYSNVYPTIYSCRLNLKHRDKNNNINAAWIKICSITCQKGAANDFTFQRGRYFILDGEKLKASVIDPQTKQVVSEMPWVSVEREKTPDYGIPSRFIVESSSGKELYLLVSRSFDEHSGFHVFQLDHTHREWTRVTDIGQDIILVDCMQAMALPASDVHGGCRGNCVVFLSYPEQDIMSRMRVPVAFNVYDIGNDTVEQFPGSLRDDPRYHWNHGWFVPTL